jgi:hypothetical protein
MKQERCILQQITASALAPTDADAITVISPEDTLAIDKIWEMDGTAGIDSRPEIVRQDDERIERGGA